MENLIIYILILFALFINLIAFVYLSYWVPKKLGKRKLRIILSTFLPVKLVFLILTFIFE